MTMNMPPPYNQTPQFQQRLPQGYNNMHAQSPLNHQYESYRPSQLNIPPNNLGRSFSPNVSPRYAPNQNYGPMNVPPQVNTPQNIQGVSPNVPMQNVGGQYLNPQTSQGGYGGFDRRNNFMRQPEVYSPYGSPNNLPVHPPQPHYQPSNYPQYQNYYQPQNPIQQPYTIPYQGYNQPIPQNYVPLYSSNSGVPNIPPVNNLIYNSLRRNVPEQSINSNFSYENANFDCNYTVEENLIHCVLCNQTYKTSDRKKHLELHREKVRNVNIRPVDQQQLKRLQKYNSMHKKGLMVKPIVEPDEFNVQYNPNEFVLRKVTQYKDSDATKPNDIQVQTGQNSVSWDNPQDLGYPSDSRRSNAGQSPQRRSQGQGSPSRNTNSQIGYPERNTNTRFNNDSIRQEEPIFLSDRFEQHNEGDSFNNVNYEGELSRASDRRSQGSQKLGYQESSSLRPRQAESFTNSNQPKQIYTEGESKLHQIEEVNEEQRFSNSKDIPIDRIIKQVNRESQY